MTIGLGDRQLAHTIWVAEIEPEGILGLDFLRQYDCQIVLKMAVLSYSLAISVRLPMVNLSLPAAFEFPLKTQQSSLLGVRP